MKKSVITVAILLLIVSNTMEVEAGNINGSEQGIIDYVSGAVWEYEGVSYRAKSGCIDQLRGKLMADDIDLSQKEANNAIMQINANVKKGVQDGYLEPVSGEVAPTQPEKESESDGEGSITKIPESNGKNSTTKASEDDQESTITKAPNVTEKAYHRESPKTSQSPEEKENQPNPTQGSASPRDSDDEKPQGTYENGKKKVDMEEKISSVLSQQADTVRVTMGEGKEHPVILEQYNLGSLDIITQDGEVIYQAEVPIKNTGYKVQYKKFLYFGAAYILVMVATILQHRKHKKYDTE